MVLFDRPGAASLATHPRFSSSREARLSRSVSRRRAVSPSLASCFPGIHCLLVPSSPFFRVTPGVPFLRHLPRRQQFGGVLTLQFDRVFLRPAKWLRFRARNHAIARLVSPSGEDRRFNGIHFFSPLQVSRAANRDDYLALPAYRGYYRGELKSRRYVLRYDGHLNMRFSNAREFPS